MPKRVWRPSGLAGLSLRLQTVTGLYFYCIAGIKLPCIQGVRTIGAKSSFISLSGRATYKPFEPTADRSSRRRAKRMKTPSSACAIFNRYLHLKTSGAEKAEVARAVGNFDMRTFSMSARDESLKCISLVNIRNRSLLLNSEIALSRRKPLLFQKDSRHLCLRTSFCSSQKFLHAAFMLARVNHFLIDKGSEDAGRTSMHVHAFNPPLAETIHNIEIHFPNPFLPL